MLHDKNAEIPHRTPTASSLTESNWEDRTKKKE
jgi:hypothetical protein